MPDGVTAIEHWHMSFALLAVWICFGLVIYVIQRNRRRAKEQRRQQQSPPRGDSTSVKDLERFYGKRDGE